MGKKPVEYVQIEVDGKPLSVQKDRYLLWSLRDAYYDVPYFCAHKWLNPPFAGCRQCMVQIEIGGKMLPKLQTSCSTLPVEGMRVFTRSEATLAGRKEQLEFHLLNHPLECPTCDKGGECMLQDQVYDHGLAVGRYIEEKRIRPDAVMNDYILMNYKRCIHCKRCIHYGENIDGSHLLKFIDRGASTWIEGFPEPGVAPRFTGNVIDMCPVGALTGRSYRFMGRPWEQEPSASVGSLDSVGANIWLCARVGEMARIIPRDNTEVEDGLIDDATRFSWECIDDPRRVRLPILRDAEGTQTISPGRGESEAASRLAAIIGEHGPDSIGVIAGNGLNTEEYFSLRLFCQRDLQTSFYHFGDELFGAQGYDPAVMNSFARDSGTIDQIVNASTVLSLGCDLFEEAPSLGLRVDIRARRGQLKLLSARSHRSDADRFAATFTDYGYGNLLRVVRGLTNALTGAGDTLPELAQLADALRAIGQDCAIVYGEEVWRSGNPAELVRALATLRQAIAAANPGNSGVYLNPVYPGVNSAGALLVSHLQHIDTSDSAGKPAAGSLRNVLQSAVSGKLKALLIADADTLSTYPDRGLVDKALGAVDTVVYIGAFQNPTSERASLYLPVGTYAHSDGTVVSMEWRVQKRAKAVLVEIAPDLLEVLNSVAAEMGAEPLAPNIYEANAQLRQALPAYSQQKLDDFHHNGELIELPAIEEGPSKSPAELPAEIKGNAEWPLILAPKRFLYNDRPETRFSPVFDGVAKPFNAYVNPTDARVLNLKDGDLVELQNGSGSAQLALQIASWVRHGSVVINDYCLAAPANAVGGPEPGRVAIQRSRQAAEVAS